MVAAAALSAGVKLMLIATHVSFMPAGMWDRAKLAAVVIGVVVAALLASWRRRSAPDVTPRASRSS